MNRIVLALGAVGAAICISVLGKAAGIDDYIRNVKKPITDFGAAMPVFAAAATSLSDNGEEQRLWLESVRQEAARRRIEPIDAKVDSVWKAVPGYNGREVDLERTLQLTKPLTPIKDIPFVYKELEPKVSLDDLGAQPVYKGNPKKPMVSLMINVAWGNEFIPSMIDILNKENVHATFFFDGSWLKKNIPLAKEIGSHGHELSNHAYSHKNMSRLGRQAATEEITKTEALLEKELGVKNKLFAPPSGDFNAQTVQIAHELKLRTVLWTLDTVDWKNPPPGTIISKVAARLEPGSMILMHPTQASSQALESIIKEVKRKGYVLGTVSELLSSSRVPDVQPTRLP
ncbi:polysaccharide deacetylase family protein [Paenibacillus sp. MBLB4367]|uniref:polysaccharide deacetylase family protein n=1 Tax=Paenibacillus sp. MBLB4367 TaxID=3384767 RepID=UPI003907FC6A